MTRLSRSQALISIEYNYAITLSAGYNLMNAAIDGSCLFASDSWGVLVRIGETTDGSFALFFLDCAIACGHQFLYQHLFSWCPSLIMLSYLV